MTTLKISFAFPSKLFPRASNGVAHILEHTVLCGSKKFPVKDPFFAMSRRSLHTFMNALTGSDFTCYPAASLNEKDFYNLLAVYLDAVFHPELKKMSFLQEGHRLEFSNPKDPKSPLEHRGIVFNEMKGSLASADSRLWHTMMQELVPDLPYAFNSGGDPSEIPNLTYEELVAFHKTYYHPSRCLFFFYGDLPLKKHLDFLAENALKNIQALPPLPPIPLQKRFKAPIYKEMRYPVNEAEPTKDRTTVSFGFLTTPLLDQEEVLALSVLDSILMETDASPLRHALLQSKLCVQTDAIMDTEMSEVPYILVCKGCNAKKVDALESFLKKTLRAIADRGIPQELIDAAIHQLELSRSEITGDHSPFGLTLFMRSALAKQHGCPSENSLGLHTLFEKLLQNVKDPKYLPGLIERYFLDNPHTVRLVMHPDANLSAEEIAAEKKELQERESHLTEPQIEEILQQAENLSEFQKATETQSLDCLPKVSIDDVTPIARDLSLTELCHKNLEVFHHDCFTNQILYADLIFDLSHIEDADLPYVHLLTSLLTEVGSGKRSYEENLSFMQAYTGGIGASCALHHQASDYNLFKPSFNLRGKALYRNAEHLFQLMKETVLAPRFDEKERIKELILQLRDGQLNRLNRQGLRYAVQLALKGFSQAAYISESWYGLRYFKLIEELTHALSSDISPLIDKLIQLAEKLMTFHRPHLVLSCSEGMLQNLEKRDFYGLGEFVPSRSFTPWVIDYSLPKPESQARPISSQVAFTAEAFKVAPYLHPHSPALTISTLLFDNKVLHRKIREQGGAYGCGASYNAMTGLFYFHAYRDPHLISTLRAFRDSIDEIASGHFDSKDLEEAKLGILQQFDAPISPGSRAITAYSWKRDGKPRKMRQDYRDRLFALTTQDLQRVVAQELLPQKEKGIVVCCAGQELLERENVLLGSEGRALPIVPI